MRATRTGRRGHSFPRARPEGVAHRTSARSLTSRRARTRRPEAGDAERSSSRAMVTLARAFAPVASGSVHRTPNPPTAVARKAARRPVRALSPGFSGAGGVRGFVGDAARGASAPARAAEGGTDVPSRGGEPKKKRRGKNRRRAPRKNDRASSLESRSDEASDEASDIGSFSPSSGAAALAIAASVDPDAATVARFMGTIDESDDAAVLFSVTDESRPEPRPRRASLDSARPDSGAVFMGTVDDDEMTVDFLLSGAKTRGSKTKTSSNSERRAAPTTREKNAAEKKVSPPASGDPDLAFLYDADAVRSISMCDGDEPPDVNDANVVARCNEVLRKARSMDDVLVLVREMTAAGVAPAESTYVAIMLVCRDTAVGPARAVEVYDAMKLVGVAPTKRSFDLAMTCAIRARRPEDALRLKEEADRARALAPNGPADASGDASSYATLHPRTFTALLKCVSECDFGRKRGAKTRLIRTCRLFEEMLSAPGSTPPPPAAFNVLIGAAARARQPDLVARTFEEMTATGVSPSRETYETALAAISAGGLVDQALDVFAAMRRDGFAPRKTTYNSLLEACSTAPQPRVEQAFEIFHRMADEGRVAPNARTFALLIDAAARANLPRFAFDAFDAARNAGVDVPLSTYNRLIRAAGGDGAELFDDGLDAVADAIAPESRRSSRDRSSGDTPDDRDASRRHADTPSGGVAVARALLAEVRDNTPLEPDVYTFGCVLGTCAAAAAAGDADAAAAARATCEEMRAANVPHNRATRHALITTLGRAGLWREALREYVDMKSVGGESSETKKKYEESGPGRETYGVVFDALLSPGGAEAAIAAVALEPGGGETFIRGARAAAARAVFRDGVDAGVFDDPRKPFRFEPNDDSFGAKQTRKARSNDDSFDEAYEKALRDTSRGTDAVVADPPMRVNHVHMTRAEAVVATLALLESFADFSGEPSVQNLPGGLFIGEGPGTKGNAQRRTLAVESVLRAASVPCAPVEDPRAYVVGVTREGLRNWAERASKFQTLDLSAVNVAALDARLDELEASAKAAETLFG